MYTKIAPISVRHDIGVEEHDQEGRVLTLEFEKFFVVTSYTPNAGDGLKRVDYRTKQWDVDFFKYLQTLEKEGKAVILGGDLNVAHKDIDMFNPFGQDFVAGFTPQEKKSFDSLLTDCQFVDTFRHFYPNKVKYSVWQYQWDYRKQNKGWRLDYWLINQSSMGMVKDSLIHNQYFGSDHCPIEIEIDLNLLVE